MRLYATQYRAALGGIYGHQIRARSLAEARAFARLRGLGEQIVGLALRAQMQPTCSRVWADRMADGIDRLHALVFLAALATASGIVTARELFDDEGGLLHLAAHLEQDRPVFAAPRQPRWPRAWARRNAEILGRIRTLERRIPGYGA